MNNDFTNETPVKGMGFYLSLLILLLFSVMGIGVDLDEFIQHKEINIPSLYFYLIFAVDFFIILGLILIFFYRKIGVFIFPFAVIFHFLCHIYFLSTFLYTDVTNLFLFVGLGLFTIIPKWQFFR
jgi:hypothetical protein